MTRSLPVRIQMTSPREEPPPSPAIEASSGAEGEEIIRLDEENAQLRHAVTSHAVVDQAIGVLIAVHQLPPHHGWNVLREVSQHSNIKLHTVALEIVQWPLGRPMSVEVQEQLAAAVHRWKARARPSE
ncbi:ANTAR domain-containing protein [Streptomyces brasiliscabiei]